MLRVQSGHGPVILDAQVDDSALGVREAHHGQDQVTVRELFAVALEFDGERLAVGNLPHCTMTFSPAPIKRKHSPLVSEDRDNLTK